MRLFVFGRKARRFAQRPVFCLSLATARFGARNREK
jgi:hypothetical protein